MAAAARERPGARVPALRRALGLPAALAALAAASGHADLQVRPGLALLARRVEGDEFRPKLRGRGLLAGNNNGPPPGRRERVMRLIRHCPNAGQAALLR